MPVDGITVHERDGYDEWVVGSNERIVILLGNHVPKTLENVLINQTATGANCTLKAPTGLSGWAIRNVAWVGPPRGDYHIYPAGDGEIENVFIQHYEGPDNSWDGPGAMLATKAHSGSFTVRNTYIAGMGDNAAYFSGPGRDPGDGGGQGQIHFRDCYFRDCTAALFRLGGPGSSIKRCVGEFNDPEERRGTYDGSTRRSAAAICLRQDITVEDCSFYASPDDPYHEAGGGVMRLMDKFDAPNEDDFSYHPTLTFRNVKINSGAVSPFQTVVATTYTSGGDGSVTWDAPVSGLRQTTADEYRNGQIETPDFSADVSHDPTITDIGNGGVPLTPEMAARGERGMPPEVGTEPAPPDLTSSSPPDDGDGGNGGGGDEPGQGGVPDRAAAVLLGAGVAAAYLYATRDES